MVQRCCVPLCDTKVGDVDIKGSKVRFHRIPLTPEKFQKWRHKMTDSGKYRPEPEFTINSRICSKHFLREDYISDENIKDKPGTPGNHILGKDAIPSIFKWNDSSGNECELSRAIPYVKKTCVVNDSGESKRNQEIQCSLLEEKLQQEIFRKNLVIKQLLQRLADLENPEDQDQQDNPGHPEPHNEPTAEAETEVPEREGRIQSEVTVTSSKPSSPLPTEELFVSKATCTKDDEELLELHDKPKLISTAQQTDKEGFRMPTCIPVQVIKRAPRQNSKLPPKKRKLNEY